MANEADAGSVVEAPDEELDLAEELASLHEDLLNWDHQHVIPELSVQPESES